jgi:hypothetical protein
MAGELLAAINLFIVEPTTDKAIGFELQKDANQGKSVDMAEVHSYRDWQKSGTFAAGAFIGMAYGAIMGVVYTFARNYLPFKSDKSKAILLAGLMFLALYLVPFSKYPANPPAVGNPDTISLRDHLYITYQITSVAVALAMGILFFKYREIKGIHYIIPAAYILIITSMYYIWPSIPDKIEISMSVVNMFRAITGFTMGVFFSMIGVFFGLFWAKFKPHESTRVTTL